jgi:class 3 adenylate cyclase/tetratricopeptide (TPR) repeat protein
MGACAACGRELSEDFAFCPACGAPVTVARDTEQRKTVTVLFCDVTGSTALGERLDPEPLRELLGRYFDRMKAIVERHGGTVEKFVGDAVLAVFGVPVLHEDDALRAVRAAGEMLDAVGDLGVRIRVGVNTGEVVAGTGERLVTGDAVNVAALLEQAAAPGEVLLGVETVRLARDALHVEPVEALSLRGKADPVPAFRLVAVDTDRPGLARRLDQPLVGRVRELRLLREAYGLSVSDRSCHVFTLLGAAGVGKTRLVQEFVGTVDARVVTGRCLSYGDGITYWPVVEALKPLDAAIGELLEEVSTDEIAFRVRKLLEAAAAEQPLVALWDDVHWAEPTFLDLIEHVADWSREVPILLVCVCRPELLDSRPGWGGGKLNTTTLLLEPLPPDDCELLLERLSPGLEDVLRRRILASADGNPLFVEEIVAMLADAHDGDLVVPPTIHALLAARIDQLGEGERTALECGAVEGQVFHRRGVLALAEPEVAASIPRLVRKELVRPTQATFPGDDAFRFRHILIRDAAYDALPKARRAELHERFADWLVEHGVGLVEYDEILGYHLEQAHRYRLELGRPADELGRRAGERLTAAGRASLDRHDVHAALSLLGRGADVLPADEPPRREALADLVEARIDAGDRLGVETALAELRQLAQAADDAHIEGRRRLLQVAAATMWMEEGSTIARWLEELREIATAAREPRDDRVVARAQSWIGRAMFFLGDCAAAERAFAEAVSAARLVGDRRTELDAKQWWGGAVRYGPTPVDEALAFFRSVGEETSLLLLCRGEVRALGGDLEGGRADVRAGVAIAEERGLQVQRGSVMLGAGSIALWAREFTAAERSLRAGWDLLGGLGERGFRSTVGALLAQALVGLGRNDEAERVALEAMAMTEADDFVSQAVGRAARARVMARRGEFEQAIALAREARATMEPSDYLDHHGDVTAQLAEVLALAGRPDEARAVLAEALELYRRKGAIVPAEAARVMVEEAIAAWPG